MDNELNKVELYQGKVSLVRGSADAKDTEEYNLAYRGFHDDPFSNYEDGMFGKTLWQGGTGEAEARAVEIVRRDVENLKRSVRFAIKKWNPDLITHYQPMTDSAGHTWMGVMDPNSPAYNAEMAKKLWPYYEKVFQLEDEWLGDVMSSAKDFNIILVSDHGMEGSNRYFYPNAVLEQAGFLKRTFGNTVEPAQTKIAAPPYGDFFLVCEQPRVETRDRARFGEGEPPGGSRQSLPFRARSGHRGADREEGVQGKLELPGKGLGGPSGGDLYLELAPGYYPSNRLNDKIVGRPILPSVTECTVSIPSAEACRRSSISEVRR